MKKEEEIYEARFQKHIDELKWLYMELYDDQEHFDELFSAHDTSNVYNQLNIRVKSWEQEGETFQLQTMRTTYFDSLVTNRAMDFRWQSGQTIRDLCAYGRFV